MTTKLKIQVYFADNSKGDLPKFIPLQNVSDFLTEKQLIPQINDEIAIHLEDGKKIGISDPLDLKHLQTVYARRFNDAVSDVAIFVSYKAR